MKPQYFMNIKKIPAKRYKTIKIAYRYVKDLVIFARIPHKFVSKYGKIFFIVLKH